MLLPFKDIQKLSPNPHLSSHFSTVSGFSANASKSPFSLVKGVYNPPKSMSKRTAKRWADVAPMKNKDIVKQDIKNLVTEKVFKLTENDDGKTLEQVVSFYFGLDPPTARLKILAGEIWLQGSMHSRFADIKPKAKVSYGDTLAGAVRKTPTRQERTDRAKILIESLKQHIIYKDRDILVLNKLQNLAVHGGSKQNDLHIETLLSELKSPSDKEIPRLVHRLDKDTTGCLILARSKEAAQRLGNLFRDPDAIRKKYLALLTPVKIPSEAKNNSWRITTGLVVHGQNRNQKVVAVPWNDSFAELNQVQKAVSDVTILKTTKLSSLALLEPRTGRKHQLRVHVASFDAFILGDYKYGIGCTKQFSHQVSNPLAVPLHLHLEEIIISNWFGEGKNLTITAPRPEFWRKSLQSTGHNIIF